MLVTVDFELVRAISLDPYLRGGYGPWRDLETLRQLATRTAGFPATITDFFLMPLFCSCGTFRRLDTVLETSAACEQCGELYWAIKDFNKALLALARIDWRLAFDAIVEQQGGYLVRPVLQPLAPRTPVP